MKIGRSTGVAALISLLLIAAGPVAVSAEIKFEDLKIIDVARAEEFAHRMSELGYKAKLTFEEDGQPVISGRVSWLNYSIRFYNCKDKVDCGHAIFSCGYDIDGKISLEFANRWNSKEHLGTFRIDEEGDPWLYHTINLVGGVTLKNLEDTLDWWSDSLDTFRRKVNDRAKGEQEKLPEKPASAIEEL